MKMSKNPAERLIDRTKEVWVHINKMKEHIDDALIEYMEARESIHKLNLKIDDYTKSGVIANRKVKEKENA